MYEATLKTATVVAAALAVAYLGPNSFGSGGDKVKANPGLSVAFFAAIGVVSPYLWLGVWWTLSHIFIARTHRPEKKPARSMV